MSETSVRRTVLLVLFVLALASQAPEGGQAPRVSVNRPLAAARSEATLTSAW